MNTKLMVPIQHLNSPAAGRTESAVHRTLSIVISTMAEYTPWRIRAWFDTLSTSFTNAIGEWYRPMQSAWYRYLGNQGGEFRSPGKDGAPVNLLSSVGVQQLVRHWYVRRRRLATVRVFSGCDQRGRIAFASGYHGVGSSKDIDPATGGTGRKPSAIAQGTVMPPDAAIGMGGRGEARFRLLGAFAGMADALLSVQQVFDDIAAWNNADDTAEEDKFRVDGQIKFNLGQTVLRWSERLNYWDPITGTSRPRDEARRAEENASVEAFIADLLVTDVRYQAECPRMLPGYDCSHLAESFHNPMDWPLLPEFQLFAGSEWAEPATEQRHLREMKVWAAGKKVELSEAATADHNESRSMCTRYQLHWLEIDGTPVEAQGPRQLYVHRPAPGGFNVLQPIIVHPDGSTTTTDVAMDLLDGFPTACVHSQFGNACYGPRPTLDELKAVSGQTPFRRPGNVRPTPVGVKRPRHGEGQVLPFVAD